MFCNGGTCKRSACGDGYVNSAAGERCETSGGIDTAGCNGQAAGTVGCRIPSCGDGYVNTAAGEQCDLNNNCTAPKICNAMCRCM